jgi:outer membrane lipoprotein carrier protein
MTDAYSSMNRLLNRIFLALVPGLVFSGAAAAVDEDLNHFFDEVRTYSALFQQVVLDEGFNPIEESSGRVIIKRPGRFRWDYEPPSETRIISNGDKVWIYDVELDQVTVRSYRQALGSTPAALLAGGADVSEEFDIAPLGQVNGPLHWVRMVPKSEDVGFEDIRIGFEDGSLRVMELIDGLGQTTRITMTDGEENESIADSRFEFNPPDGVDVIDETAQ